MRRMRSREIRLVLIASTTMTIAGCDKSSDEQAKGEIVQEDVTLVEPGKCADVGLNPDGTGVRTYTPEYCAQAEQEARTEFEKTAPVYAYREDCIAQHGEDACRGEMKVVERDGQAQSGYMPAFGGFVVGTAAALAAAHIFHTMQGNATGRVSRPIPVYTTLNDTCRTNPNAPNCRPGTGGGGGGGSAGARGGYSYGYNGYTVAEPNGSTGRMSTTVTKTASGGFAPMARGSASGATGARGGAASGVTVARGGFGASAAGHSAGG